MSVTQIDTSNDTPTPALRSHTAIGSLIATEGRLPSKTSTEDDQQTAPTVSSKATHSSNAMLNKKAKTRNSDANIDSGNSEKKMMRKTCSHFDDADLAASELASKATKNWASEGEETNAPWLRALAKRSVESWGFNMFVGVVIFGNAISIGIETNAEVEGDPVDLWALEIVFIILYTFEIAIRIVAYGCTICKEAVFWFDVFLVAIAVVDNCILRFTESSSDLSSIVILRMLRLFKLARIFRLFRLLRELWLLMSSIIDSIKTLFWAGIFSIMLIYVSAILITRLVSTSLNEGAWHGKQLAYIEDRLGTVPRSMFTLFECMVGGDWTVVARHCMAGMPLSFIFWILYVCLSGIALLNVIVAMIVESTMKKTMIENEKDKRKIMEEEQQSSMELLMGTLLASDESGDGSISRAEWTKALRSDEVLTCLAQFELNRDQGEALYDAIDLGSTGELGIVEFVQGIITCNRPSRAYDVVSVQCDILHMRQAMEDRIDALSSKIHEIEGQPIAKGKVQRHSEVQNSINGQSQTQESRLTGVENTLTALVEHSGHVTKNLEHANEKLDRLERLMEQLLSREASSTRSLSALCHDASERLPVHEPVETLAKPSPQVEGMNQSNSSGGRCATSCLNPLSVI